MKEKEYEDRSKEKLERAIERKFRTTFIGSLDAFQQKFGYLWGDGTPISRLTSDQLKWRHLWEQTRNAVLDNGNSQLRAALTEIDQYTVKWNRYHIDLPIRGRNVTR